MENNTIRKERLYSLDALRGFDMLWIIGAESIVGAMAKATNTPFWNGFAMQLEHAEWNGFRLEDLIFPLFLFIAGVAVPYSVGNKLEKGISKAAILRHVFIRSMILVAFGFILNNGLAFKAISEYRFPSVLGRIGLAYLGANLIYLFSRERVQYLFFVSLLVGYWLLLSLFSAPGFPAGDLSMEGNFASYVDRMLLPGTLYLKIHDPEGILSTFPAIATGLLGIFSGGILRGNTYSKPRNALILAIAGISLLLIGTIWGLIFPINKNLWTSSFMMFAGGLSLLLLSGFYYVIDVLEYKKWAFPLTVIGTNSILIYMSWKFIDWTYTTTQCVEWLMQLAGNLYAPVVLTCCALIIKWFFLYFLYKKKVFLKV
jgi:predicted acyltransferase